MTNKGEMRFKQLLETQNIKYEDVTANPNYFAIDIDFLVGDKKIEVKSDSVMWRTGNLFIETATSHSGNHCGNGWIYYTEADEIWYYDERNDIFYVFNPEEMKHIMLNFAERACQKRDSEWSVGRCVPAAHKIVRRITWEKK